VSREELFLDLPDGVLTNQDIPRSHLLSRESRQRVIGRCCHALYRWYVNRSQEIRNKAAGEFSPPSKPLTGPSIPQVLGLRA
jgi:hypothetical protein